VRPQEKFARGAAYARHVEALVERVPERCVRVARSVVRVERFVVRNQRKVGCCKTISRRGEESIAGGDMSFVRSQTSLRAHKRRVLSRR
jgi:hypothetical protein